MSLGFGQRGDGGVRGAAPGPVDARLDDVDALWRSSQGCAQVRHAIDARVCGMRRRAERLQVDSVRSAEHPLERPRVGIRALLEGGEDRTAVVVDDDEGEVRSRLTGSDDQAVGVVEKRHVPHKSERARGLAAA